MTEQLADIVVRSDEEFQNAMKRILVLWRIAKMDGQPIIIEVWGKTRTERIARPLVCEGAD